MQRMQAKIRKQKPCSWNQTEAGCKKHRERCEWNSEEKSFFGRMRPVGCVRRTTSSQEVELPSRSSSPELTVPYRPHFTSEALTPAQVNARKFKRLHERLQAEEAARLEAAAAAVPPSSEREQSSEGEQSSASSSSGSSSDSLVRSMQAYQARKKAAPEHTPGREPILNRHGGQYREIVPRARSSPPRLSASSSTPPSSPRSSRGSEQQPALASSYANRASLSSQPLAPPEPAREEYEYGEQSEEKDDAKERLQRLCSSLSCYRRELEPCVKEKAPQLLEDDDWYGSIRADLMLHPRYRCDPHRYELEKRKPPSRRKIGSAVAGGASLASNIIKTFFPSQKPALPKAPSLEQRIQDISEALKARNERWGNSARNKDKSAKELAAEYDAIQEDYEKLKRLKKQLGREISSSLSSRQGTRNVGQRALPLDTSYAAPRTLPLGSVGPRTPLFLR
jgi:hypothetical protein